MATRNDAVEWPGTQYTKSSTSRQKAKAMPSEHEIELRVRYQETDPMGFLHHANYFAYFEIGRTELLRASGGNYREMEEAGLFVVVVKAECRFRSPARYDDLLRLRTTVVRVTHVVRQIQLTDFLHNLLLLLSVKPLFPSERIGLARQNFSRDGEIINYEKRNKP